MITSPRIMPAMLMALVTATMGSGCVGPACGSANHAPLQIIGHVQNANQQPVPNKSVRITVAAFMQQHEAIKKVVDDNPASTPATQSLPDYQSQTDVNGDFAFSVPARSAFHSAAVIGFIVIGGGTAKDEYIVLSTDGPDSQIYLARLHKRHLTFSRINKTTYSADPVSTVGSLPEITGNAKRSKEINTVTLKLTVP